jgi:hypothetical protein
MISRSTIPSSPFFKVFIMTSKKYFASIGFDGLNKYSDKESTMEDGHWENRWP